MSWDSLNGLWENRWLLAVISFLFFAIKGCLWLVIPIIALRWRKRTSPATPMIGTRPHA